MWVFCNKIHYIQDYSKTNPEIDIGYIQDQVYAEDVVVHSSNGYRWIYNESAFFGNVFRVVDPRIRSKVKDRQQKYQLQQKLGVHLRGSDRASNIDKSHRMSALNNRLVSSGILNRTSCVAVSDDPDYVSMWKGRYSSFPVLTEVGCLGGNGGVHTKSKDTLAISKDSLNVDMLVDFFTLASCNSVLSTSKDSRFAQEAQRLHPHINQILG